MVFPCIEPSTGGELCFISSTHGDLRASCNPFGKVTMQRAWKGWEVWRFVSSADRSDGSFFISSWTHSQFYLSSHPGGNVFSSKDEKNMELWKVEKVGSASGNAVLLRSLKHGRLLLCQDGHLSTVEGSSCGSPDRCLWNIETANLGNFFLHCNEKDKQIGCPKSVDETPLLTEHRKDWEVWRLYLRCENKQLCLAAEPGSETWSLVNHEGLIAIVSSSGGYLACCSEGRFFIANELGDTPPCTSWRLEPKMPSTLSGKQIGGLVGGGILTLGLGIAMPFAIVGAITGMGFTTGGIAAGSAAAGMMSAEAISLGGAVAAGGTVATLQSIGAVGLGMAGTAAAVSGGALVGAGVSASALGASGIMNNEASSEAGVAASDNLVDAA
ncbi:unnamed protein product [Cylindrotheca closterium]|uniref:Fascin domain-containing protein n=1 Tax=Cylindrotheca closterium TaxID=2856 RepID=A0AAD2G0F2_9STRA|nr:unnamed protein product [Cylindrotheca closterium]